MPSTKSERLRKYDITTSDYAELSAAGDDCCWICKEPESVVGRSLAVDHDHATGSVRGLLCTRCNQTLGRMNDSAALLRAAADYLELARARFSDYCRQCRDSRINVIAAPSEILETDGVHTRFIYRCESDHVWTCGWRTKGWYWL